MGLPVDGFAWLEAFRKQNGARTQNYRDYTKYLDYKAREKGVPIRGQFELTPLCNFSCKMCYVHLTPEQMKNAVLSTDTWKGLIRQASEAGMIMATLTGGECLTYPGFDDLFLYLHSLGCEVTVLTNGYLLDEKRIAFFLRHKPAKIQISLYGWNDDVYERVTGQRAFRTVSENIRRAIAADLPVVLSMTPSVFLGEDALETVKLRQVFGRKILVNAALFSPREETGRAGQQNDPDLNLYIRLYRQTDAMDGKENREIEMDRLPPAGGPSHECAECGLTCGGGRSGFVIDWKGAMHPCNRMSVISALPLKDGFKEAWAQVNRAAESWPRVPECVDCPYTDVCNRCAANQMRFAEPGKQPLALCEQTRELVRCGICHIPDCD